MNEQETNINPPAPSMPTPTPSPKLPGVGALLKDTWSIYRTHWRISAIIQLLTLVLISFVPMGVMKIGELAMNKFGSGLEIIIPWVLIGGAALSITLLAVLALQAGQLIVFESESPEGLMSLYKKGRVFALSLLWANILTALVTFGGFLLLLVPGIILTISLIFVSFVVIIDGYKGLEALRASREYVRGRWWPVTGRMAVLSLFYLVITIILSIAFALIASSLIGFKVPYAEEIATWSLNMIYSAILTPLTIAFIYKLLKEIKSLKGVLVLPAQGRTGYALLGILGAIVIVALVLFGVWMGKQTSSMVARDSKRVFDINAIQAKLEVYMVENGRYPNSLIEIGSFAAPLPNDGTCSPEDNEYQYAKLDDISYSLSFCLGADTQRFKAGKNQVPTKMEQELMRTLQD